MAVPRKDSTLVLALASAIVLGLAGGFSPGPEIAQLNGTLTYPTTGRTANQLATLAALVDPVDAAAVPDGSRPGLPSDELRPVSPARWADALEHGPARHDGVGGDEHLQRHSPVWCSRDRRCPPSARR